MNNCCFTGYVVDSPRVEYVGDILRAEFILLTYGHRKTKATGEKARVPTYIVCETWHTAAEAVEKFVKDGTKMTVQASAKNVSKDDECVTFRVNEFDICKEGYN